ncbi:MAG: DUF3837 domain-containing protein [Agathobacter sp.]|nr:DUF3837 domain-containing protein [Agathobacter sp.]
MVPSIARQSVIIKCNMQKSVLLGNYEFYYLSGLMAKLFDLDLNEDMMPRELLEKIHGTMDTLEPKDEKEAYLLALVKNFKPQEEVDEQMKELFRWGATEENLWQVQV